MPDITDTASLTVPLRNADVKGGDRSALDRVLTTLYNELHGMTGGRQDLDLLDVARLFGLGLGYPAPYIGCAIVIAAGAFLNLLTALAWPPQKVLGDRELAFNVGACLAKLPKDLDRREGGGWAGGQARSCQR